MRLTIERIRTLVLVAGALLLFALGIFLAKAKWKNVLNRHDLPQRLAKEIQQEANGFDYVHTFGAHSQYRIHASKEVQLRNNHIELHQVQIELYGADGARVDQIDGDTFVIDQKSGLAIAEGPVEMVLTRPTSAQKKESKGAPPAGAAQQIHLKTSGVTFDRDSGMVSTAQRVDFSMAQGEGSATGAMYDSQSGYLTLEKALELTTRRGGDLLDLHAQHAEFDRTAGTCVMRAVATVYRGEQADAETAKILFRPDGSASRLDATGGFTLTTATGGHLAAPTGSLDFDEHNEPLRGHMEGGVAMDSLSAGRNVHASSPIAELEFVGKGQLHHVHMERGVAFSSEEESADGSKGAEFQVKRSWNSPVADVEFRDAGKGRVELATMHGTGGVVITSEDRRSPGNAPAKMAADEATGSFGPNSSLRSMVGTGHASIEETTVTGAHETANGDKVEASFAENRDQGNRGTREQGRSSEERERGSGSAELESAELDGHVVLFEQPATKTGAQPQAPMRATAGKAVYEGSGEWLHLTISPRVVDSGLELTADKVDVSQQSGDAFAHGNVKATWIGGAQPGRENAANGDQTQSSMTLGSRGPAHVIAAEAQVNQTTGIATFRGHARLWQQANSVAGPEIELNQHAETLIARTSDPAEPVRAVLLNAGVATGKQPGTQGEGNRASGQSATPSIIRVRGGELWYSDTEHRAVMRGGTLGAVVAETSAATSSSDSVELKLTPAGSHDNPSEGQAQVDHMTASGHVVLTSQGRRGTGGQLLYTGASGDYTLTGTTAAPPRMTDPERGSVTGNALIFHSRDDSVSIEGGGSQTRTETTAPDVQGKQ